MKTKPHNLPALCRWHTQAELVRICGVSAITIRRWCEKAGLEPAYRCFHCKQAKPPSECKSMRRCLQCDEDIRNGTCTIPKKCTVCGVTKPSNEFVLLRARNTLSGSCKTCQVEKLRDLSKPPQSEEICAEVARLSRKAGMPATGGALRSRLVQGVV